MPPDLATPGRKGGRHCGRVSPAACLLNRWPGVTRLKGRGKPFLASWHGVSSRQQLQAGLLDCGLLAVPPLPGRVTEVAPVPWMTHWAETLADAAESMFSKTSSKLMHVIPPGAGPRQTTGYTGPADSIRIGLAIDHGTIVPRQNVKSQELTPIPLQLTSAPDVTAL
jgi:hypothetical protein